MALTKTQLRQLLGMDTGRDSFMLGVVASGPTTSQITVDEFIDSGADEAKHTDKWVYLPDAAAADRERRITSYTPGTGIVSFHRPMSVAPTAGWTVELHRFKPSLLNQAIEDALSKMAYTQEISIAPTTDTNIYSLAAYTYIRRADDIRRVEVQVISSGYESRVPVHSNVKFDGVTRSLVISPPLFSPGDGSVNLVLTVEKKFEAVTGLEAESFDIAANTREELWVRAGMKAALYQILIAGTSGQKEIERYNLLWKQSMGQLRNHAKHLQPRVKQRIGMAYPYRGTPEMEGSFHLGWR